MRLHFVLHCARGESKLAPFFISVFLLLVFVWFVMHTPSLKRYAWLSIAAAILTIGLKYGAYWLTGSVGLLSDALESLVNLAAAIMALAMISLAERPPDDDHAYGHTKAEYFASAVEGGLILLAAYSIGSTALTRLANPAPLENVGWGVAISVLASLINLGVALILRRASRRYNSITLDADAKHLMTDVWTSVAVIAGIGAVTATGFYWLDPVIALAVAVNIVVSGVQLVQRSALGLMDTGIPAEQRTAIVAILERFGPTVTYHSLRTRVAGQRSFVSVHILVPGSWSVQQGHDRLEEMEEEIRHTIPGPVTILTHLEPAEDPVSMADIEIDRIPNR